MSGDESPNSSLDFPRGVSEAYLLVNFTNTLRFFGKPKTAPPSREDFI